jgi:hypothetical protein
MKSKNKVGIRGRETRWEERKMEAPSEEEQCPEGAVAPYTNKFTYKT